MAMQIVIWWLVIQAFGLAGLPLARFLFRALPDRGYAFAKALGLLLTSYLAWLLAMLGLAPFGTGLLVVSGLVVGAIGLIVTREPRTKNQEQGQATRSQFSIFNFQFSIPSSWRLVLGYEVLFALMLIFLALLRSRDFDGFVGPNPWNTERPMDYALFNAIRRSASFPPHDPWLSGYSINYYYFGYMLMAAVSLLSGLDPAVSYNLSLALIFALTALCVAGIVYNLITLTPETRRRTSGVEGSRSNVGGWLSVAGVLGAVVLAVILVLFAANQGGALQIITGTPMAVALEAPDLGRAIVNGLGPREPLQLTQTFKGEYFDGTSAITPTSAAEAAQSFNYWNSTRAVWDTYIHDGERTRQYAITEFPFFSFWLGDMHPHVMALPFGLLALALVLQTVARPAAPPFAMGRRGWLELALTGIVLGSLYAINSWDFPTYLLLFLGALLLLHVRLGNSHDPRPEDQDPRPETQDQETGEGNAEGRGPRTENQEPHQRMYGEPSVAASAEEQSAEDSATRTEVIELASTQDASPAHPLTHSPFQNVWWRHYLSQAVIVVLASIVMLAPFYLTFHSLVGGKEPLVNIPILATITRTLGFVTESRTTIYNFLIIFGLFLLPLIAYVVAQGRSTWARLTNVLVYPFTRSLPWIALAALVIGPLIGFPMLVLLPLALYAGLLAADQTEQPAAAFVLWAFAIGCLICFGTDIVYIRDVFEGLSARMNTIFKFYYQAWLIWGILAGYTLWWLASRRPTTGDRRPQVPGSRIEDRGSTAVGLRSSIFNPRSSILGRWVLAGLFGGLFALLLAGALVYPWLTAGRSLREKQSIGIAGKTPLEATPEGAASIVWLRENVPGNAVVLEAVGGAYNTEGFGGVAAATGLATVLGWPGHEDQWRGGDSSAHAQIGPRQQDVTTIYTTTDMAQAGALLAKYKVDYVYVGSLERAAIAQAGAPQQALDKFAQLGEPVFQQGDITIYHVTES